MNICPEVQERLPSLLSVPWGFGLRLGTSLRAHNSEPEVIFCLGGAAGLRGSCFVYSLVSIRGGSLHVSKTQNSTYFLLPEALLAPCSQRRTSHRAWPPRCRRASTPQGRLGWGSRRQVSPRGLGRRPWRAHSSPWIPRSKPFLQPPSPPSSCTRPPLHCWVSPSASVCAHRGHTCPPCAPPGRGCSQESLKPL